MPGAARDPRTGLPPRAAGILHGIPAEKPLHPRNIIRQTVYCQAAARRFINARRKQRGVAPLRTRGPPAIAVACFFSAYLRNRKVFDAEEEANIVCALICSKDEEKHTLKLGDLSDAYDEYYPHLKPDHRALMMVVERFDEIALFAEEELLKKMEDVALPSEGEARLKETIHAWRSPDDRPGGSLASGKEHLWKLAKELIDKLRKEHEQVLIERLPIINNQEAYGAMMAEVEREFVGARTVLRAQLRGGRNRHRALIETELQTMYGWPPTGPGPSLKRAARSYLVELGAEHPMTEDFVAAVKRHLKKQQERMSIDMADLEKEILRLRSLVNADPPAPKLMHESYVDSLNEKCHEALQRLEVWKKDLGTDDPVYLRFLESTLAKEPFLNHCEAEASEVVNELRPLGPRPPPCLEENHITETRNIGACALAHWIEALEAGGRKAQASKLQQEFASELRKADPAVKLLREQEEEEQDGWHQPPGFSQVDAQLKPPTPPPPPPPPKEIRLERELPGMRQGESLSMRLHGVSFEDVHRHHEALLLEMCADIIAEECKIPRDCIFNMSFSDPKKVAEEKKKTRKNSKNKNRLSTGSKGSDGAMSREMMGGTPVDTPKAGTPSG